MWMRWRAGSAPTAARIRPAIFPAACSPARSANRPRGQIIAQASEAEDELLIAEMDMDMIREVRDLWQFFRDRRPEMYGSLSAVDGV